MRLSLDRDAERSLRELAPRVLGAVVRRFGDFAACEDAVQEALIAAATQWPEQGVPDNPRGWLIQVAFRRVTDQVRAEAARRRREHIVVSLVPPEEQMALSADSEAGQEHDDSLDFLFMCCHPSLSRSSAIALTLRAVGGLTTCEIARAFMVPEATIAQRISRAKQTLKAAGVSPSRPSAEESAARLDAVLHVLYLMFSEGYATSSGSELTRADLCNEAIRLTRDVHRQLPEHCEGAGLLALMLLTDARRAARSGAHGELIPIDEQDRRVWDTRLIEEGVALLSDTLPKGKIGEYQLQAAIAAVHDEAPDADHTDWPQILALYTLLMSLTESPIVALNHAVASAMVHGPRTGLGLLEVLERDPRVANQHRLAAVRAHLLERAGDLDAAITEYRIAASRTTSTPERDYLMMRAARLKDSVTSSLS